jgi:putative transposase
MSTQFQQRKEAVQLYYYHHLSKAAICRQLSCSRSWLDRWLKRYDPDDVEGSLRDRSPGPQPPRSRWPDAIREQVLEMRRMRSDRTQWPYAFKGAAAIHYELHALQIPNVPPIRTIHSWLVQAGLVSPSHASHEDRERLPFPEPVVESVNTIQQLDLKGPLYLHGSNHKYSIAVLRDRYSCRCALSALQSREALGIVDFLVKSWHWLGGPSYLQMDNATEFRGSLSCSPRSFGRVVRVAVDLGIEPLFNPPGEPWRNGGVERHNGFVEERVLPIDVADFEALQREVQVCQHTCNATHRIAKLNGLTPNEVASQTT